MKIGYTLIELMIVISIVSILVVFGVSSYARAQGRQIGRLAGEKIVTILSETQKNANIGKKDCLGKFLGYQVEITRPSTINTQSLCDESSGVITTTQLVDVTFAADYTLIFNPLSGGVNLGVSSPLIISYDSSTGLTYNLKVTSSGTIEFLGVQ